jgi:hypothetical protein
MRKLLAEFRSEGSLLVIRNFELAPWHEEMIGERLFVNSLGRPWIDNRPVIDCKIAVLDIVGRLVQLGSFLLNVGSFDYWRGLLNLFQDVG